jgi:hypothetical protein
VGVPLPLPISHAPRPTSHILRAFISPPSTAEARSEFAGAVIRNEYHPHFVHSCGACFCLQGNLLRRRANSHSSVPSHTANPTQTTAPTRCRAALHAGQPLHPWGRRSQPPCQGQRLLLVQAPYPPGPQVLSCHHQARPRPHRQSLLQVGSPLLQWGRDPPLAPAPSPLPSDQLWAVDHRAPAFAAVALLEWTPCSGLAAPPALARSETTAGAPQSPAGSTGT